MNEFDLCTHQLLLVLQFIGVQHVEKPFLFQHFTLRSYKIIISRILLSLDSGPKLGLNVTLYFLLTDIKRD